jgi:hypothetical protein
MTEPHDAPTAAELVEAVREFLEQDVRDATEGRVRFHARVAANVLAMVERELAGGEEQRSAHRERLAALGMADDAELAAAIRSGVIDLDSAPLAEALWQATRAKVRVANPDYLEPPDRP